MNNKIICVYAIKCKFNNKIYIGQTTDWIVRKSHHKHMLKINSHDNIMLQKDYNLYGLNGFDFMILEKCSVQDLLSKETYWINYYGGKDSINTYNMRDIFGMNKDLYNQTLKFHKNNILSDSTRQKLIAYNKKRGTRKYSEQYVQEVRNKYNELKSYKETALYFNLNKDTCSNLIKFGTSQRPYKYVKI